MKIFILMLAFINMNLYADSNVDLGKYYTSFKNAALDSKTLNNDQIKKMNNISIVFAQIDEIPDSMKALCVSAENKILINKQAFIDESELGRQEAIDHEMGHCVLDRSHYNQSTLYGDGREVPTNIMHHSCFAYKSLNEMKEMRNALFRPEFYGTAQEVDKLYKNVMNEVAIFNGAANVGENFPALRMIEHRVMEERIEKYQKLKNK